MSQATWAAWVATWTQVSRKTWLLVRFLKLMSLWVHLNDRGGSPGRGFGVEMRHVGHAGQRCQSVHLAHGHGNRGWRQACRNQRMWHHHEGQLIQNWRRKKQIFFFFLKLRIIEGREIRNTLRVCCFRQRSDKKLHLKTIKTALGVPDMTQMSSLPSSAVASVVFLHDNIKGLETNIVPLWCRFHLDHYFPTKPRLRNVC